MNLRQDVIELNDTNWEKNVEKGEKPIFVMFYSPTCPYCKQIFAVPIEKYFKIKNADDLKRINKIYESGKIEQL